MASARRTGTNENVSTFGDGTRDYTSLATWEAATDNNLVSSEVSEVIECYDDESPYDQSVNLSGATTNSSYFRIIRAALGHRHNGVFGAGVRFNRNNAGTNHVLTINEQYSQAQDLELDVTGSGVGEPVVLSASNTTLVGIITKGNVDNGISGNNGLSGIFIVDCIVADCVDRGITNGTGVMHMYNCTVINSGNAGITVPNGFATNCIVQGSGGADFDVSGTTTCLSQDATGDIQSTLTFVDAGGDNYQLAEGDTDAINAGTDLTADPTFAFDDDVAFVQFGASGFEIGAFSFAPPVEADTVTLNRPTRAYGTVEGHGQYELQVVQTSNFVYFEVTEGPTDRLTYVEAHIDSFEFITDEEEAEAIGALIVAGGV